MNSFTSMVQDLRYAFRLMRSSVGLTAVAIISLALGIGSTVAIFSVMYALILRPLPVFQPDRLVQVSRSDEVPLHSYAVWRQLRDKPKRVKSSAATLDPSLTVEFRSLTDEIKSGIQQNSTAAWMGTVFGLFAGLLAMIGVYGVTSYASSQRMREIGIRMALGAQREDALRLILGDTAVGVILGVAFGIPAGLVGAQMIRGLLWGVAPSDVRTFLVAVCLIVVVAFAAAFLPARRATRVNPVICLRYE